LAKTFTPLAETGIANIVLRAKFWIVARQQGTTINQLYGECNDAWLNSSFESERTVWFRNSQLGRTSQDERLRCYAVAIWTEN